jgi:regulator of protease activity HflC (stomatin/prohibitin superfamily)
MGPGGIIIFILLIIGVVILCSSIRVVKQANAYVIENLGTYKCTWGVGLHILIPIFEKVARRVSLKEQVADFPPQPVITKDNVTMRIDTVLFFQITDPKLYCYGVENPLSAIENLTATTLRNIIGDLELDQTLTSRETINAKMRATLDEATDPWGIKVNRVEVKNILPPKDIRESMERQMRAERERREKILLAEGEKKSQILLAEGQKESQILRADADKQAKILAAEAQAESIRKVKEAEAAGIRMVREAEADGLKALADAKATPEVLTLRSYEAVKDLANGQSTKIVVPSDLQNLATLATTVKNITEGKK